MNGRGGGEVVPFRRGEAPEPIEPFEPFYVAQLEGRTPKPREWLIDGVLMPKTVCLFAGPPKMGKSLLVQQLLTASAIGVPWLGRDVVQARGFGMFTEDPEDEIHRRQIDCNTHYGRSAADLELELSLDPREGKSALLVEFERFSDKPKFTPLWTQLWNYVADEGVRIVAIDTAAVVFGGNENFRSQVTVFMRALVSQAVRMDGSIVLTAHPAKGDARSYSGSSAWLGSSRFGLSLGRPSNYDEETDTPRDVRVLRALGANYGPGMRPQQLLYRDGVFQVDDDQHTSASKVQRGPQNRQQWTDLHYRILAGVKKTVRLGGKIFADDAHYLSLPQRARKSPDPNVSRVPISDLIIAQNELLHDGRLMLVEVNRRILLRAAEGEPYPDEKPVTMQDADTSDRP